MTPYYSPLRYPGGKRRLANFVKLVVLENDLCDCEYVEPYAGGASVALTLLLEEFVSKIHINDLDRCVYAFWHSVINETDEFCARIEKVPVTMREWRRQRKVQERAEDADLLDLGLSTLFMNRTNRSGVIRGGVIGGKAQAGEWKLDVRFGKKELLRRIRHIGRFRPRISLTNMDASELLANVVPGLGPDALVYLDPPYYAKGQDLYQNRYSHEDHQAIRDMAQELQANWIVSYDLVPEVSALYGKMPSLQYSLQYTAADRYKGSEVMFYSKRLALPRVGSPVRIPDRVVAEWDLTPA